MTIGNIEIDLSENTLVLTFDCIAVEKKYAILCYVDGDVVYYIKAYINDDYEYSDYEFLGTKRLPAEIKELVPSKEKAEKMFITNNGELPKKLNLFLIENMLGVTPEFISYLKEWFEKNEPANHEMLIRCRVCYEMKDIMNIPDDEFNKYPWLQIGVRCWKNNTAKDVLFMVKFNMNDIMTSVIDGRTTPGKGWIGEEWIKWLIDKYGELKWPDEKGHVKYANKILSDNDTIQCIRWDPCFEWKNGRIVEGPDFATEGGRVKWESIYEGLTKIFKQKKI